MSFVDQNDVLEIFEGLLSHLLKKFKKINVETFKFHTMKPCHPTGLINQILGLV